MPDPGAAGALGGFAAEPGAVAAGAVAGGGSLPSSGFLWSHPVTSAIAIANDLMPFPFNLSLFIVGKTLRQFFKHTLIFEGRRIATRL